YGYGYGGGYSAGYGFGGGYNSYRPSYRSSYRPSYQSYYGVGVGGLGISVYSSKFGNSGRGYYDYRRPAVSPYGSRLDFGPGRYDFYRGRHR
ncbi:MAG: hypothetical protein AAF989_15260, partial [Planctomycetota bacterium]